LKVVLSVKGTSFCLGEVSRDCKLTQTCHHTFSQSF